MSDGIWQINEQTATLKSQDWVATVDLAHPSEGLKIRGDQLFIERLFSFVVNDDPLECFVRDVDLVLRFPPRNTDLVSYEAYFRACTDGRGLELILSAQTQLLESKPETKVTSMFPSSSVISLPKSSISEQPVQYFLVRPTEPNSLSVLLITHPSDFYRAAVDADEIAFWVFPDSLEKGVIRRARFQMRLLQRASDEELAVEAFAETQLVPPPLAT